MRWPFTTDQQVAINAKQQLDILNPSTASVPACLLPINS
jgi:hypothetical protein